jgi:mannose-6-phosphate isomerase-like protein (cupin superfamily)
VTTTTPAAMLGDLTQFASLEALKAEKGAPPWSVRLVTNQTQQAFLIHQGPGHPNDTHYHEHDEWWVVLEGRIAWYIEGREEPVIAEAGQIVYGPANRWHHIEILGDGPSTRLAINTLGEFHRYDRPGCGPAGSPDQWRPEKLPI